MAHTKPYGSWKSPITSSMIVESAIKLGNIVLDKDTLYWNEIRPLERGRSVVLKWDKDKGIDVTSSPYNVRTCVHEYGGGSFTVYQGTIYFANFKNQHFCSLAPDGTFKELTTADNKRYANPVLDPEDNLIYAIEETHLSTNNVINSLVVIDPIGEKGVRTLHSGHDFYSSITLSPDRTQIAFLTWNHPLMPWDGTELWTAQILPNGTLAGLEKIAGNDNESIFQPRFAPDGKLFFISDRTGFWNLYEVTSNEILPCYPLEAEFGSPQWVFGMSRYDFIPDIDSYKVACSYTIKGIDKLAILDLKKYTLQDLPFPFTSCHEIHVAGNKLYFIAASSTQVSALYCYNLADRKSVV